MLLLFFDHHLDIWILDDIFNHEICTFTQIYAFAKPLPNMHNKTFINDVDNVVIHNTRHGISLK